MQTLVLPGGGTAAYIDEGREGWRPLVFVGGGGTSVRAFRLLEFARGLREDLELRVISVERNGFGQTTFDASADAADYADRVRMLLEHLGVEAFSLAAISAGGPYAAQIASAMSDRVLSLHLACAVAGGGVAERPGLLGMHGRELAERVAEISHHPAAWWEFPAASPVHRLPGFMDSAREEAVRAFFVAGQLGHPGPLIHELRFVQGAPLPPLEAVAAPAYLYWGEDDELVPLPHLEAWRHSLPGPTVVRRYPGEGHDVQYRHWDQLMYDVSRGGDLVAVRLANQVQLLPPAEAGQAVASGGSLGWFDWTST